MRPFVLMLISPVQVGEGRRTRKKVSPSTFRETSDCRVESDGGRRRRVLGRLWKEKKGEGVGQRGGGGIGEPISPVTKRDGLTGGIKLTPAFPPFYCVHSFSHPAKNSQKKRFICPPAAGLPTSQRPGKGVGGHCNTGPFSK